MRRRTGKSGCAREVLQSDGKVNDSRDREEADCARELNLEVVC